MSENQDNKAVSPELREIIHEVQSFKSLAMFALAGGTSLALRYNHRRSLDIDLFTNIVVGVAGLEEIKLELSEYYGKDLHYCQIIDPENGEQYCFLRALVAKGNTKIKVEAIQNIQILDRIESFGEIRVLSLRDIALLKLMSAGSRKAKKDIYDLDYLSDAIGLEDLLVMLNDKLEKFSAEKYRSLFDLDDPQSPAENLELLLAFDENVYKDIPNRPNHSNDIIDILPDGKSWISARIAWKNKVKSLMRKRGIIPPPVQPIN